MPESISVDRLDPENWHPNVETITVGETYTYYGNLVPTEKVTVTNVVERENGGVSVSVTGVVE